MEALGFAGGVLRFALEKLQLFFFFLGGGSVFSFGMWCLFLVLVFFLVWLMLVVVVLVLFHRCWIERFFRFCHFWCCC